MTAVAVHSDFGAQENKICHCIRIYLLPDIYFQKYMYVYIYIYTYIYIYMYNIYAYIFYRLLLDIECSCLYYTIGPSYLSYIK